MVCLKDKQTNKILGVSYSRNGLRFIANKTGKLLMYRNARIVNKGDKVSIEGDTALNNRVYVDKFEIKSREDTDTQVDALWNHKASIMSNYGRY
jgi:hypothetical protein